MKWIHPMEPVMIDQLKPSANDLYQIKWDGVRILANIGEGNVQLYTRKHRERTRTYPEVRAELEKQFAGTTAVLDGEMVAVKNGKPDFFEVMKRDRLKSESRILRAVDSIPVCYMVFDLLYLDGTWLTDLPLAERLKLLENRLENKSVVRCCPTSDDGESLWRFTEERGWEGIVIKERSGVYHFGRKHPTWRKLKHFRRLEALVAGCLLKGGVVHSLLLAVEEDGKLRWIGRAASGLTSRDLSLLTEWCRSQEARTSPAVHASLLPGEEVVWLPPVLKVKVKFMEWSPDGTLRSPVILGFVK
ncbi:DNA ligase [Staphylospora marina]|uniref:ATP-dependent DNA ligase n=1 Tax=Staphylospora marina TaxID=2490858 RepID=UPI000F5BA78F|nr:DNA ligase [Staphylospora marina]